MELVQYFVGTLLMFIHIQESEGFCRKLWLTDTKTHYDVEGIYYYNRTGCNQDKNIYYSPLTGDYLYNVDVEGTAHWVFGSAECDTEVYFNAGNNQSFPENVEQWFETDENGTGFTADNQASVTCYGEEFCRKLRLGGVSSLAGTYSYNGTGCHGKRNVYYNAVVERFLYHFYVDGVGLWVIGYQKCGSSVNALVHSTAEFPEHIADTWEWYNGSSLVDKPMTLTCISEEFCTALRLSQTREQKSVEGIYYLQDKDCLGRKNTYYSPNTTRYLYYQRNWIFGISPCSDTGYLRVGSTAEYPELITETWEEVNSFGSSTVWRTSSLVTITCVTGSDYCINVLIDGVSELSGSYTKTKTGCYQNRNVYKHNVSENYLFYTKNGDLEAWIVGPTECLAANGTHRAKSVALYPEIIRQTWEETVNGVTWYENKKISVKCAGTIPSNQAYKLVIGQAYNLVIGLTFILGILR